jgi:hypothetical protein
MPGTSSWDSVWQWFADNEALLAWLFVGSIASLVLCAVLLPIIVVRLPADYFSPRREHTPVLKTVWHWLWHIAKNVLGVVFVLAGLAMLVLPGQGLLTILIGLLLLDFPGKRRIERLLVRRPSILGLLNRMRERRGRPPLIVD